MIYGANADAADRETLTRWIRRHARPLTTLDPQAPLTDLRPLRHIARHATVVGLGVSHRGTHELFAIQYRILRFLVEQLGFRSLALEEDWTEGIELDEYVRTGEGDPRELLADARFSRTEEMLGVIRWMRSYNQQHPADPLRIVGVDIDAVRASAYDAVADYVRQAAPQRSTNSKPTIRRSAPPAGSPSTYSGTAASKTSSRSSTAPVWPTAS